MGFGIAIGAFTRDNTARAENQYPVTRAIVDIDIQNDTLIKHNEKWEAYEKTIVKLYIV